MRWSVKDILGATTAIVLVLVAKLMVADFIAYGPQKFILAFYVALAVGAGVLAILVFRNKKGTFFGYSLFCTIYGILFLRTELQAEVVMRLTAIGILLGLACAIGVGLVARDR